MMDDLMLSDFMIYHTFDAILGHISSLAEIYRSSRSCMLISTYKIHIETMTLQWSLSGAIQLGLHLSALRCHHASFRDTPLDLWVRFSYGR